MRPKLDENIPPGAAEMFRGAGHDALTVRDEGLLGHEDDDIAAVCRREGRAIVTLDLDFADVRSYPPGDYPGIIVLRLVSQDRPSVLKALGRILPLFDVEPVAGHLWIADDFRLRIRGTDEGLTSRPVS